MARIVIIGGSGHVGTNLVPALVERGHEVVNVSRGTGSPYRPHPAWKNIEQVLVDRKAEEAEGKFGSRIAGLNADIVIDMISYNVVTMTKALERLAADGHTFNEELVSCISPYLTEHINRFGRYTLKRDRIPEPLDGARVLKMPPRSEGVGRAAIAAV
jgi:NAD(P)-dependent dehydrogenase (short-subunit alcohol dehydrogenase family)